MGLKCLLASMDGMTHAAFRSICFEYGADGATTEMIPALSYARAKKRSPIMETLLHRWRGEGPLYAQILGSDPVLMGMAASRLEAEGRFEGIEINMGCPARKVVGSGNGSALLQRPELAEEILHRVLASTHLPVRLKLRLGWDGDHITAPQIVQLAQQAGCSEIILHGRTRQQLYRGDVQLEEMRRVRAATQLPLYANGAVTQPQDAFRFAREVGADGVCIGRAALKAPWIFEDIRLLEAGKPIPERDARERIGLLLRLAERCCQLKPERFAIQEARKFAGWYLPGLRGGQEALQRIHQAQSWDAFRGILVDHLDGLVQQNDLQLHPELLPAQTLDTVREPERRGGESILI